MADIQVYTLPDPIPPTVDGSVGSYAKSSSKGELQPYTQSQQSAAITENDVVNIIRQQLVRYPDRIRVGSDNQSIQMDHGIGLWIGNVEFGSAPFSVDMNGNLVATSATISGTITASAIHIPDQNTTANSFHVKSNGDTWWGTTQTLFDASNRNARAYVLRTGDAFFQNVEVNGIIKTTVFQKDVVSAVGGQLLVANSDVLDVDMTALDSSTLTIKGSTTFSLNSILHIKDGTDEEYLRVTNIGSAPEYTVTRDLAGAYGANANPAWKKGTAVVVEGLSDLSSTYSGGYLKLFGSGTNAPKYSVFKRTGVAYNAVTEYATLGNLNGRLDYVADDYGVAIGTTTDGYISFDATNGLRTTGKITAQEKFTSGHVIDAGSCTAIESDGKLYRTRATNLSTENTAISLATSVPQSKIRLATISSTASIASFLNSSTWRVQQIVTSPTSATITAPGTATGTNTAVDGDAVQFDTDKVLAVYQRNTTSIYAYVVTGLDSTLTKGTEVSAAIGDGGGRVALVKVSATECLLFHDAVSAGDAQLKVTPITISGTTPTFGSTTTLAAAGSSDFYPVFAERFGTSDYYMVLYYDGTFDQLYAMCIQYTGGVITAGSALTVQAYATLNEAMGSLAPTTSSTVMAIAYRYASSGTNEIIKFGTISRSGTTLSLNTMTTQEATITNITNAYPSLNRISTYTYGLGYLNSVAATLQTKVILLSFDGTTTLSTVGSAIAKTGLAVSIVMPILGYHSPTRVLYIGGTSATATAARTTDITTNYATTIGVSTSAVAANASVTAVVSGRNSSVTGLSTGNEYYADLDGGFKTAANGGTKRIGVSDSTSSIIVQV